jgi:hypothetical protein
MGRGVKPRASSAVSAVGGERRQADVIEGVEVAVLYRPVGQGELDLISASSMLRFPPRFAWQPIFYPVLNEEYATKIARDWNTKDPNSGFVGYVTRFAVKASFLDNYQVQQVGGRSILEYWIPSEDLEELNDNIVGAIELIAEYRPE